MFVSAISSQKLISAINILHQSRRAVWYAEENVGVLIEENIGESGLGNAVCTSIGDKKNR